MKSITVFLTLSLSILFIQLVNAQNLSSKVRTAPSETVDTVKVSNKLNEVAIILKQESNNQPANDNQFSTSDYIAVISALFALIAIFISILSAVKTHNLANKDFLLTHRPFVWVENFGYLNSQNSIVNSINEIMIMLLNSPAKFHKEYFEYYIIDNLNNKTIIETQEYFGQIRYPSEKSQYTNTSSLVTPQIVQALTINQELERIIKIDYSWLSSEKKYFFEAKWRLDKVSQTWKVITQTAD